MKKIFTLALALIMVLSLGTVAFAATYDNAIISVPAGNDHYYAVYQIFKANVETVTTGGVTKDVLTNVVYGANANVAAAQIGKDVPASQLAIIEAVTDDPADTTKLGVIKEFVKLSSTPVKVISDGDPAIVPTGYYLIADLGHEGTANPGVSAEGEGLSLYITKLAKNEELIITPKTSTTTSEKKVKDPNDGNVDDLSDWQDAADWNIGDDVEFQITAHVSNKLEDYTHGYKLTFHDTMSEGLTFNEGSVKVYVNNNEHPVSNTLYTVKTTGLTDDCTFEVHFNDVREVRDELNQLPNRIDVRYTAKLNENAVIGIGSDPLNPGNPNASHITFTNDPNAEGAPEKGYTPDDVVTVFTFKLVVNKFANDLSHPLNGAEFTLFRGTEADKGALVKKITGTSTSEFTFKGLDAGHYVLEETKTPTGYNTIKPIEIVITADHDTHSETPTLHTLTVTPDTFTAHVETGTINANVINHAGKTLPSTGGIGTTIFYVAGSVLVVGAAVLLITKKRVKAN